MKNQRALLNAGVALGALMGFAPFAVTAFAVRGAFATLRVSGIGDPRSLSRAVAEILASTAAGFILVPVGLGVVIFCVVVKRHRFASPPALPPLQQPVP